MSSVDIVSLKREALGENEHVLSTGVVVRIKPVSSLLIQAVTSKIPDPVVPIWHDENTGRDTPNPLDPAYVAAMERATQERGVAALDAMILMGVELVDGLPEDNRWLKRLRKTNALPDGFDETDEDDVLFAYIKLVAFGGDDLQLLTRSQVTEGDVERAEKAF